MEYPPLTENAIKLLTQAKEMILKYPEHYDQTEPWLPVIGKCGSKGCVLGFIGAVLGLTRVLDIFDDVAKALGLDNDPDRPYGRLYRLYMDWPDEFGDRLNEAREQKDPVAYAQAGADMIDAFIATNGNF